jgi:hypothetical protein
MVVSRLDRKPGLEGAASASYSDSAVTWTAYASPAWSRQETRQERRAMRRPVAAIFEHRATTLHPVRQSGWLRTKLK